jgi:septum site-determining protein MinD
LIPSKISIDDTKYISYLDSNRLRKEMKNKQGVFILDFPPGLDEGVEKLLNMVDEVYVVTTPDVPSVTDSIKTVSFVRKNKKPVSGLVLNRVEKTKYEIPVDEIEMLCECPVVSILKEDSLIKKSIYQETPAHMINDINENSLIFEELAHKIVEKDYKRPSMIPLRRAFRFLRE